MTALPGVFIAGDASGIEEASTAMLEGRLAGIAAAERLRPDLDRGEVRRLKEEAHSGLRELRAGPFGERPRPGKRRMLESWKREAAAARSMTQFTWHLRVSVFQRVSFEVVKLTKALDPVGL